MIQSLQHILFSLTKKVVSGILLIFPLIFIVGYFYSSEYMEHSSSFLLHSLLACGTTFLLVLFILNSKIRTILPIVVLFLIFIVGYYIKFYWILYEIHEGDLDIIANSIDSNILRVLNPENLLRAFELTTYGYLALLFSVFIIILFRLIPSNQVKVSRIPIGRHSSRVILAAAFFFTFITSYIFYVFGIGVRGAENVALPFKLTGIITYVREFTFFLFLIVLIWAEEQNKIYYWYLSLVGLMLLVGSKIFIEASRGALVAIVIALGTFWLSYNRFTRKRVLFLTSTMMAVIILRPLFTIYREIKNLDVSLNPADIFMNAFQLMDISQINVFVFLFETVKVIFLRVIGIDSVLYLADVELILLDFKELMIVLTERLDFAQRFTQDVVGYGYSVTTHFSAPSLIGGTYLLGGVVFMIAIVFLLALISQYAWKRAFTSKWKSKPVIMCAIAMQLFSIGSEGNMINSMKEICIFVVFLFCLESILRFMSQMRNRAHNMAPQLAQGNELSK